MAYTEGPSDAAVITQVAAARSASKARKSTSSPSRERRRKTRPSHGGSSSLYHLSRWRLKRRPAKSSSDVPEADREIEDRARTFDGAEFVISKRRWAHIIDRHSELTAMKGLIMDAASRPDEAFEDPRGSIHLVKALEAGASDYLILILRKAGVKDYLVTAYLMGAKRKNRRYRKFKKLPLS